MAVTTIFEDVDGFCVASAMAVARLTIAVVMTGGNAVALASKTLVGSRLEEGTVPAAGALVGGAGSFGLMGLLSVGTGVAMAKGRRLVVGEAARVGSGVIFRELGGLSALVGLGCWGAGM